jgi:hypothetical protein
MPLFAAPAFLGRRGSVRNCRLRRPLWRSGSGRRHGRRCGHGRCIRYRVGFGGRRFGRLWRGLNVRLGVARSKLGGARARQWRQGGAWRQRRRMHARRRQRCRMRRRRRRTHSRRRRQLGFLRSHFRAGNIWRPIAGNRSITRRRPAVRQRLIVSGRQHTGDGIARWRLYNPVGGADRAGAGVDDDAHQDAADIDGTDNVSGAFAPRRRQRTETRSPHRFADFVGRHKTGKWRRWCRRRRRLCQRRSASQNQQT